MKHIVHLFNIRDTHKQLLFITLLFFLASFSIARAVSVITGVSIFIRGYQIHHFYFGTLCLAIGGIIGTASVKTNARRLASAFIGTGLGLFSDEIGLLLNCTTEISRDCRYAFPGTYEIIGVITAILLLIMATTRPIERLAGKLVR